MARNLFISFLGTNNYIDCNYYFESDVSKKSDNVKYIQEALIKIHQSEFGIKDKIVTFCTEASYKANYLDNGLYNPNTKLYDLQNEGLESQFKKMNLSEDVIEHKIIKEGFSENEIWEVFRVVNKVVEVNDTVYFDITHAFRYLPMMGLVLLNYLKVTKKIKVKGLFYGAFEKLGFAQTVKSLPLNERNAPILNLLSLFELNDWTQATHNFVNLGNANDLSKMLNNTVIDQFVSLDPKKRHKNNEVMRILSKELKELTGMFTTNRGKEIIEARIIENIRVSIDKASEIVKDQPSLSPLSELLIKIKNKVEAFKLGELSNGFVAVEWCVKHDLFQQGITLFQEFLISFVLTKIELDYNDKNNRNTVSAYLSITNKEYKFSINETDKIIQEEIIKKLGGLENIILINKIFADLSRNRNDIQHAGFNNSPSSYNIFEKRLNENFNKFKEIL